MKASGGKPNAVKTEGHKTQCVLFISMRITLQVSMSEFISLIKRNKDYLKTSDIY